ncbi:MAG TPA: hypothetical protein VKS20_13290 [Candidatus Acidoferrales bacterium]|nr:hypothetical protein [Candidatus Acidoferrales bacterium]
MEREYDIFEQLPGGSPVWRGHASGLPNVRLKLQELAATTANECYAIHLATKEVVARLTVKAPGGAGSKRLIFQIAYDGKRATERAEILRLCGYEVVSVIGNEAAKVILSLPHHCDLFVIGQSAPEKNRKQMAAWLRDKYPGVRILALNSPGIRELAGADYNVESNGPKTWLRVVTGALGTA